MSPGHATGWVVGARPVHRRLHRVVIHSPNLDSLALPDVGDAAIGVYFPAPAYATPVGRTYTVREHDPAAATIAVDVLLHGDATGTRWATGASEGDRVELAHAGSWYSPPDRTDWQLLVCDLAGLPAVARLIEQRPKDITTVIVEVLDAGDLDYLPSREGVVVVPSIGTGNGVDAGALTWLAIEHGATSGRGYCWFAGEAGAARAVRKHFRLERRWSTDQLDVMGYWRRDADDWTRRFTPIGPEMYAIYQKAIADGKGEKVAMEEYDAALETAGL